MLTIKLARVGRKKHPHYRLIISEKARDTYGRMLEILGHYHPLQKEEKNKLVLNTERIKYWLAQGAKMSNTVNNLLIDAKLITADKLRSIGTYKSKKEVEVKTAEAKPTAEAKTETEKSE